MGLVKTEIDGREIEVERDRWALGVAKDMGIDIPTLCHHPALEPSGACRLCVVEVTKGKWTWLTTSCDLPIREGLSIKTNTPAVLKARRTTLELLWTQAPDATEIQELAKLMGLEKPRFDPRNPTGKCILCGLCTRACKKILGRSAISFANRGAERIVGTPFGEPSDTCIGCQVCVTICPTGHVRCVDEDSLRRMETWNTDLEMIKCDACGAGFAPAKELEFVCAMLPEHLSVEPICPDCRRRQAAGRISEASRLLKGTGAGQNLTSEQQEDSLGDALCRER